MKGELTYRAEGNDNPNSSQYSARLRLDNLGRLVIGRGYPLYLRSKEQIIEDFTHIGFSAHDAHRLANTKKLSGEELKKFLLKYGPEYELSKKQERELFEREYSLCEKQLNKFMNDNIRRYGVLDISEMPEWFEEILVDLWYAGDVNARTQDYIFPAVARSIRDDNPYHFERLLYHFKLWTMLGISEDRMKMRCMYIRDGQSIHRQLNGPVFGLPKDTVDDLFLQNPEAFWIEGIHYDPILDDFSLVLQKNLNVTPSTLKNSIKHAISLNDLVLCLKIIYDPNIKHKCIGIAHTIDPNKLNYGTNNYKRVVYPDCLEGKDIVRSMGVYDDLDQAMDILFKISKGDFTYVDRTTNLATDRLEVPREFEYLGLQSLFDIDDIIKTRPTPKRPNSKSVSNLKSRIDPSTFLEENPDIMEPKYSIDAISPNDFKIRKFHVPKRAPHRPTPSSVTRSNPYINFTAEPEKKHSKKLSEDFSTRTTTINYFSTMREAMSFTEMKSKMNKDKDSFIIVDSANNRNLGGELNPLKFPSGRPTQTPTSKNTKITEVASPKEGEIKLNLSMVPTEDLRTARNSTRRQEKETSQEKNGDMLKKIMVKSITTPAKGDNSSKNNFFTTALTETMHSMTQPDESKESPYFPSKAQPSSKRNQSRYETYITTGSSAMEYYQHPIPDIGTMRKQLKSRDSSYGNQPQVQKKVALLIKKVWLLAEQISVIESNQGQLGKVFLVKDAKMKLEPKLSHEINSNYDQDEPLKDKNDSTYIFTKKMNEVMDKMTKYYPCFARIKQIAKAWAFAKWLVKNGIPIDKKLLDGLNQRQQMRHFVKDYVVVHTEPDEGTTFNPRITVSTLDTKWPMTSKRLPTNLLKVSRVPLLQISDYSSPQSIYPFIGSNPTNTPVSKKIEKERIDPLEVIMFGVLINFGDEVLENQTGRLKDKEFTLKDMGIARKIYFERQFVNKMKGEDGRADNIISENYKVNFPLVPKVACFVCERRLKFSEMFAPHQGKFYCRLHHPNSCAYCFKVVTGSDSYVRAGESLYHKNCAICRNCGKPIGNSKMFNANNCAVHISCREEFLSNQQKEIESVEDVSLGYLILIL